MREAVNPYIVNPSSGRDDQSNRLPPSLKPFHYDVYLEPHIEEGVFEGSVIIHCDTLLETTFIVLNALDLEIVSTFISGAFGSVTEIHEVFYDKNKETITIPLPQSIPACSRIEIHQTFKGRFNGIKSMSGFMRGSYIGADGQQRWMASTQGQPTGIRSIFPCADEPALKATFTTTVVVDRDLTCVSNMNIAVERVRAGESKKVVTFHKTPPMSTYLFALVVGKLHYVESTKYTVPVRIYCTTNNPAKNMDIALDLATRSMISHEQTFRCPYPLPKIDMIAVPNHSGGMENWGCVICAETILVQDQSDTPAAVKVSNAHIIIHELAHQWFGNIVTADWWNALWLNESFADWATSNAVAQIIPGLDAWSDFVAADAPHGVLGGGYQTALKLDSNRGTHPIEVPVSSAADISQIFDAVTYNKGCSILRMIADYLGVDVFIKGVRAYLEEHKFGNAETKDLWNALSAVSGKDLRAIASKWTKSPGYPILSVVENENTNLIEVSQQRFYQSRHNGDLDEEQMVYPVFLRTLTSGGVDRDARLFERKRSFPMNSAFYKLNAGQSGFYRVAYPVSRWRTLGHQIRSSNLSAKDRVGLISDFCAIVAAGYDREINTVHFLEFLQKFHGEENYFVWRQMLASLDSLRTAWIFEDPAILKALSAFRYHLICRMLLEFGNRLWEIDDGESIDSQNFKATLFAAAADSHDVHSACERIFRRFLSEPQHVPLNPNLRQTIFETVATDSYADLLATFRKYRASAIGKAALYALGAATRDDQVETTLKLTHSSEVQGLPDELAIGRTLKSHRNGIQHLWDYLRNDWDKIVSGVWGISSAMRVSMCIEGLTTCKQLKEVEDFFKDKDTRKFDKYLSQGLDAIRSKAEWVERDGDGVRDWLRAQGYLQ